MKQLLSLVLIGLTANSGALHAKLSDKLPGLPVQSTQYFLDQETESNGKSQSTYKAGYFFTGKPYDSDLGSFVFKYRNYDPNATRWCSNDPSGFPDGANNYTYAPAPTFQIDPDGLAVHSLGLFWHWLEGSGTSVNLPWEAFDSDDTVKNLTATQWRIQNYQSLRSLVESADMGYSTSSFSGITSVVPGFSDSEPGISHYDVYASLLGSISIDKYWTNPEGTKWSANLNWTLQFSALDTFNFNPGDSFGPFGFLQDDWFIAFQQLTEWPADFSVVSYSTKENSYTIKE